jgi:hypothetical protein
MNGLSDVSGSMNAARECTRNELDEPDPRRCVRHAAGFVNMRRVIILA